MRNFPHSSYHQRCSYLANGDFGCNHDSGNVAEGFITETTTPTGTRELNLVGDITRGTTDIALSRTNVISTFVRTDTLTTDTDKIVLPRRFSIKVNDRPALYSAGFKTLLPSVAITMKAFFQSVDKVLGSRISTGDTIRIYAGNSGSPTILLNPR